MVQWVLATGVLLGGWLATEERIRRLLSIGWPVALIFGGFLRRLTIACARSSSPNPFPSFSTSRGAKEVTKLPLHARLHRPDTPAPALPFPAFPGYCVKGAPSQQACVACSPQCAGLVVPPPSVLCSLGCSVSCPAAACALAALTASTLPPSPSGDIYVSIGGAVSSLSSLSGRTTI
jgi:hypothetical protein